MPNMITCSHPGASRSSLRFPAPRLSGRAGTSFKPHHLPAILADEEWQGFFEVHAENYMGAGGAPHHALAGIRARHPLSLHGVGLSIGGLEPIDKAHLARLKTLVDRYEPALVSEHLAWSSHGGTFFNDLLPLPYSARTFARVADHIDEVQATLGRAILLENPSTYVAFQESTMSEPVFIRDLVRRSGCGLLLDVNNVFVSAANHGYSARDYIADLPLACVDEIHLAGHRSQHDGGHAPLLIDSHDAPVARAVWEIFEHVIGICGPIATLIERDSDVPPWPVLKAEAEVAQRILDSHPDTLAIAADHAAR